MAKGNNLNVKFNGDASGVKKASQEARSSIKTFEKTSSDALDSIAGAFGINTQQIKQYQEALKGAITKFTGLGKEGSAAMSGIAKAASTAASGIAGLGIGAAVLSFKQLNAEAEAFKSTTEGINMQLEAQAYRDTFQQALFDTNGAGSQMTQFIESIKNRWTRGSGRVTNWLFGGSDEDYKNAIVKGQQAQAIQEKLNDLRIKERNLRVEIAGYDAEIARCQETIRDTSASVVDRQQAMDRATQLINEKYAKQIELQDRKVALMSLQQKLATSSEAAEEQLSNEEVKQVQLEQQQQQELNGLIRMRNSINKAAASLTSEIEKQNELLDRQTLASYGSIGTISTELEAPSGDLDLTAYNEALTEKLELTRKNIAADLEFREKLSALSIDLQNMAWGALGEGIGTMVADLAFGGDALQDFSTVILQAMAQMAIEVGEIAIAAGVGVEGIKKALNSLNPYAAIAAGVALVALGTAVRMGLSAVASRSSYSSSIASSNYSGGSGSIATSSMEETMTINVTGTLQADGSKLVAVLNNEAKRRAYTG